ncbi:MAG: polysaccharide pyruvyl transferase family protein [Actinobacteria bacterium]|nr:polysaccharide pyruvyl transferase family protein [Actinomycetota bacterium]NIS28530.1 polysaccharide pyruvyl transferase family protein [Actinomycetota bacterium]NIU17634.1 polysaccharide pyruvyl transferase family protein [Actinomycetota bacterium]NIU64001.1 polysaccharide pyruvyl transferase family protein [Actinomycetota bacterium]NIV85422.1 hypothetical protein [Actinomycetota bacterium]
MTVASYARRRLAPAEATLRYVRAGSGTIRYLGWLGHQNLGDEAVHQAAARYLAPGTLAWRPERVPSPFGGVAGRLTHTMTMLGGGTLLGGRYIDDFVAAPREQRAVFGSGVIDPAFPHSYRGGAGSLDRWVDAIRDIPVLGVRGPRSQEILAERGVAAEVIGDPVAAYVCPEGHWDPVERTIGLNVGQSNGAVWGSELSLLAGIADSIRALVADGWSVEYYVVWPGDLEVTRMIARDTGTANAPIHTIYVDPEEFLLRSRHLTAFVGLKLHAVALATCAGVPSASIEYHPKCRDFMASIGLDRLVVRSDEISGPAVGELVARLVAEGPAISAAARDRLTDLRALQQAAASRLVALARG